MLPTAKIATLSKIWGGRGRTVGAAPSQGWGSTNLATRTLWLGTLLAVALGQPAAAETWWPADSKPQEDYRSAYDALMSDPGNPALLAAFANEASRIGNYEAAIGALEAILIQNPGLNQIRVELGVMYYRVGAYDVSRFHLQRALDSGTLSPSVAARALAFLETDGERMDGTTITGYLSAGLRYDSNPAFITDNSVLFAFDESAGVVSADSQNSPEDDFAGFLQGYVLWSEDLGNQYGESWDTTALGYWRFQFDQGDVDIGYNKLTSGPRLAVLPGTLDNAYFRPYAIATVSFVDEGFTNVTGGGGATVSKRFGTWLGTALDGNVRYRSAADDDYSGLLAEARASVSMALTEDVLFAFGGRFQYAGAEADFRSYTAWGAFASLTVRYDAPLGITDFPWEFTVQGDYRTIDYQGVNPAVGADLDRNDQDARVVMRNTVGLSASWFLYVEGGLQTINSSIPNYEADNNYVAVGATWRF